MKKVMIVDESTDKLVSNYEIKQEKVNEEFLELKKLYDDVSIDIDGDIIVFK